MQINKEEERKARKQVCRRRARDYSKGKQSRKKTRKHCLANMLLRGTLKFSVLFVNEVSGDRSNWKVYHFLTYYFLSARNVRGIYLDGCEFQIFWLRQQESQLHCRLDDTYGSRCETQCWRVIIVSNCITLL